MKSSSDEIFLISYPLSIRSLEAATAMDKIKGLLFSAYASSLIAWRNSFKSNVKFGLSSSLPPLSPGNSQSLIII